MSGKVGSGQSGGVSISGSIGRVHGDIVGRDKTVSSMSVAALDEALEPVRRALVSAPEDKAAPATAMLAELKREVSKGDGPNDGTIAKLVDGMVSLVPAAASAVASAFATPVLGGLVGPVTTFVLSKLRGG